MSDGRDIFVSVGAVATADQETFVAAVEERLRSEGFVPHTLGRNTWSVDAPLKAVIHLMEKCSGAVVIAFERSYFPSGISKRGGPKAAVVSEVKLPTPWNQIEATMAYSYDLPLMVIVEEGLQNEGLLEQGYDWHVQSVKLEAAALVSKQFNGVLASWKEKIEKKGASIQPASAVEAPKTPQEMTVGELLSSLKPGQLWSVLGALAAVIAGAFALGAKLFGGHH